jgi:hypothetical protein
MNPDFMRGGDWGIVMRGTNGLEPLDESGEVRRDVEDKCEGGGG